MVLSRAPQVTGEQATASQVCQSQPSCFQPDRQSAPHLFVFAKTGEKCEIRDVRCYGTRSRAASSRRDTYQQVGSARASPLTFSLIASRPRRFYPSLHRPSSTLVAKWRWRESKQQAWTKQSLPQRYLNVGCQLKSDQAIRSLCLKGHVRARGSTLWRHRWQESSEFLCTKTPLFGESWATKISPKKTGNALSDAILMWGSFRWFIRYLSSVVKSAALKKSWYPQVPGSIPAENMSTQIHMDLS